MTGLVRWRTAVLLLGIAVIAALVAHLFLGGGRSHGAPARATPRAVGGAAGAIVLAAGDISCGAASGRAPCEQSDTANLIAQQKFDALLTLGDTQYECGSLADFMRYFGPTWGRFKDRIHPAIGNHEYNVSKDSAGTCGGAPSGAPGYWQYFGGAASPSEPQCQLNCKGYYSWDLAGWHLIALNLECVHVGGCGRGSAEERWLAADLAAHPAACTLAYFHEPRWSSGHHGDVTASAMFWDDLYEAGADIVLNGHDHDYERFAPQTPSGAADGERGLREFVVGTGGRNHTGLGTAGRQPNSEAFNSNTFGVLKLTLEAGRYDWQFLPVAGQSFTDSGTGTCHS